MVCFLDILTVINSLWDSIIFVFILFGLRFWKNWKHLFTFLVVITVFLPKGNSHLMPCLETRQSQMRHFKKPRLACFEFKKLDKIDLWQNYTHLLSHKWVWSTFQIQNMGNEAFKIASFGDASFGNGNEDRSCLWAISISMIAVSVKWKNFKFNFLYWIKELSRA